MAKQYQVKYLLWDEEGSNAEYHEEVDVWMFDIEDLDEAINIAKELIDIYQASGTDYNDMFSLSDRHFGTYREDRLAKTADGIRAWVECM